MTSSLYGDVLTPAIAALEKNGNPAADLDARLLLAEALGVSRCDLLTLPAIDEEACKKFQTTIARRLEGEPLSRILGRRSFWKQDFMLAPDVFDPRPETETLISFAVEQPDRPTTILDLGTGTGAILLSVLGEKRHWRGLGIDLAPAAVRLARANGKAQGLSDRAFFLCADWRSGFSGNFDRVFCNPPYIEAAVIPTLAREVKNFDPHLALSGGADGLEAYRALAHLAPHLLKKGGQLLLELGAGQADSVAAFFNEAQWQHSQHKDLSGLIRVLALEKLF